MKTHLEIVEELIGDFEIYQTKDINHFTVELVAERLEELKQVRADLMPEEMETEDKMVRIDKNTSFRCHCTCNVFRNPKGKPDIYICNACGERYKSE